MPTLDERVAFLEGRVDEHSRGVGDMRALVVQLDGKVDRRIDGLDGRFEAIDRRFETIDRRFEAVDRRFEDVDRRFTALEGQIGALDQKVSRQFLWLMGALTTVLVSVIGSLLGVVLTLG
jgi:tetrahydromethanopterin S-methyltransferase subunit G